jgi:hypothetical protein
MTRSAIAFLIFCLISASAPALAETPAGGDWRVEFVSPSRGDVDVNMTLVQNGTKLTGRVIDEYGEYPIEGRLVDDQLTVVFSVPENGKMLEITLQGKLQGDTLTGTAKLGNVGEGPMSARRTSRD